MSKSKKLSRADKIGLSVLVAIAVAALSAFLLNGTNIPVLNPKGTIAEQEKTLLVFTTLLMLIVVIPVFVMTFWFPYKYRVSNKKAKYSPELAGNRTAETIWWAVPSAIILILAVITWFSSHSLDPFKPIESNKKPLQVQVVALQWKWLFIYPEQGVASVNYLQIPEDTPINFDVTSDAPMNSFWIPQLGGQIYAMNGMSTKLHLIAEEQGSYEGRSANISGEGFANMDFEVKATSKEAFNTWAQNSKTGGKKLDKTMYAELKKPSQNMPPEMFVATEKNLYSQIISGYMAHEGRKRHQ